MLAIPKLSVWQARAILLPNPAPPSISGLLISVGPPGFTAFGRSIPLPLRIPNNRACIAFLNLGHRAIVAFPAANILQTGGNGGQVFQYLNVWFSFILMVCSSYRVIYVTADRLGFGIIFSSVNIDRMGLRCHCGQGSHMVNELVELHIPSDGILHGIRTARRTTTF
jgi:hypothetical protein